MTTTTPLVRVDTTVNTDVKYSKVFALAFVKIEDVTGVFTEDQLRPFVIPKLSDATLFGSAIVQLDSLATGHNYHSGKGDETFTGLLTKVFSNGIDESNPTADDLSAGIDVYFVTMDGVNETAMRMKGPPPFTHSIYGYRNFINRFDSTITFDDVGDKMYTTVTNYELVNPMTDLLTLSTQKALVLEASASYELPASTERMLLNPIIVPDGTLEYPFTQMYPNPTIYLQPGNEHATFSNGGLSGYYKVESGGNSNSQLMTVGLWTDKTNGSYTHFHPSGGIHTLSIDIDLGITCLIDQIKYFANEYVAPQACYIFASDTEINANVDWPTSAVYFTNVDAGIVTVNGIMPIVMTEILAKTTQDLNDDNYLPFPVSDVLMSAQYIPWLGDGMFDRILAGRYVRMYVQTKNDKRYDESGSSNYVGATLIQCFGKPTTSGVSMSYNLSNMRNSITQYYSDLITTTISFMDDDHTIPDPTQFYKYTWFTGADNTTLLTYKQTPITAQLLLNPIVTYTQGTSNSVIDTTSLMTDAVFTNFFPYRLYPTTTTFTYVNDKEYTFTDSIANRSGYYKFSNCFSASPKNVDAFILGIHKTPLPFTNRF